MDVEDFNGVIHCPTLEDAKEIISWFNCPYDRRTVWENDWGKFGEDTGYRIARGEIVGYAEMSFYCDILGYSSMQIFEFEDAKAFFKEHEWTDDSPELDDFLSCFGAV